MSLALAAVLALAVPVSIAHTSLVGAYVVIVLLAAAAVGYLVAMARRGAYSSPARTRAVLVRIGAIAVVYGVVVTIVHATR